MNRQQFICRKMFFQVLWPSLISAVALSAANMADAVTVGNRMGESGLAAIGMVTPLYMLYNVMGLGFSAGGGVTHSRLAAAGREDDALAHFRYLAVWLLAASLGLALMGNLLMQPLLSLLGANKAQSALRVLCEEYARPIVSAAPIFLLNFLLYDLVRCDNGAELATLGFSVGCVVDLLLNILFVLVLGWGVPGSAWATVIAQMTSVAIMSTHFFRGKGILHVKRLQSAPGNAEMASEAGRSLRIGFSTSARYVFQFLFLMLGNRLLLQAGARGVINGEIYVAVFDVVMNVSYLAYGIYQAFSDTMQPLASTFSAEHDRASLRYLLVLAIQYGLIVGMVISALICLNARPVSLLFGLKDQEALAVSMQAIPIFCLSTPFAGITIILTGFYQSTGQEKLATLATVFRTIVFLLPATFAAGLLFPHDFWWLFLVSEGGSLCALIAEARINARRNEAQKGRKTPVFSATMDQDNRELGKVLEGVAAFCEREEIPMKQAMLIELAVEELCVVTQEKAFTGKPDEYICLTLAKEQNGDYVLHIRNSAPYFNPLDMRMGRLNAQSQEELLDSVGVMLVRKRAKDFHYRNYQGFNVMTVTI